MTLDATNKGAPHDSAVLLRAAPACPDHAAQHRCSQGLLLGSCTGLGHAWAGCDACADVVVQHVRRDEQQAKERGAVQDS